MKISWIDVRSVLERKETGSFIRNSASSLNKLHIQPFLMWKEAALHYDHECVISNEKTKEIGSD